MATPYEIYYQSSFRLHHQKESGYWPRKRASSTRTDGQIDGSQDGRIDGSQDGRIDGYKMAILMDGRIDGSQDGRIDGS